MYLQTLHTVQLRDSKYNHRITDAIAYNEVGDLQHVVDTLDENGIPWELVEVEEGMVAVYRERPGDLVEVV